MLRNKNDKFIYLYSLGNRDHVSVFILFSMWLSSLLLIDFDGKIFFVAMHREIIFAK
jgi:hypothetical protein